MALLSGDPRGGGGGGGGRGGGGGGAIGRLIEVGRLMMGIRQKLV